MVVASLKRFCPPVGVCAAGFAVGQSPTTELTGFNYYFLMHFLCWLLVIANAALGSGTNTNNGGRGSAVFQFLILNSSFSIVFIYERAWSFSEGIGRVKLNGQIFLVDKQGNRVCK